jgi:outer membrane protein TolC
MTRWISAVLALLTLRAAPAEELSLDQALGLALKNNRLVVNARLEVEKTGPQIEVARTYRLPQFKLKLLEAQADFDKAAANQ